LPEYQTEHVLVVPAELFRRLGYFQGFCGDVGRYLDELLRPENTSYRPRNDVERDPSWKQLIPYTIFRHAPQGGRETVFQYTRGKGMGEGRLHSKRSVGVGGHISSLDAAADGCNPYQEGMRRELDEEVAIGSPYQARCVGLINDDQTDVGSGHLGVVYIFDLRQPDVRPREEELIDWGFRPVETILADLDGFETWSQISMRALFGKQ